MKRANIVPINIMDMLSKKKDDYISTSQIQFQNHDVFIDSEITDPENYREFLSILFNANENDTINLFINSGGGNLDTAMAIIEGLKSTRAHTTAIIIGACHSASSMISMYCHEMAVMDNAYSMVHTATAGSYGNVGNAESQAIFTSKQVEKLLYETYCVFLTESELERVKQGVEYWFNAEEIKERMNKRFEFIQKREEAMEKAKRNTSKSKGKKEKDLEL